MCARRSRSTQRAEGADGGRPGDAAEGEPPAPASRALGDPGRLAAHEIRSHLAVLSGYISMLADGSLGQTTPQVAQAIPEMQAKARAIAQLVDDMLEDARLEDGRLHLSRRRVDLRDVVEQAVAEARSLLPQRLALVLELPAQAVSATVDPGRVRTILRNLLDNAVKYSPDGGTIECRLEVDHGRAVITVADEGIGVEPAEAHELFRRFARGRAGSSQAIGGVGLGLYICRTLAELHGGSISARRRPERGSEFRVTLPLE